MGFWEDLQQSARKEFGVGQDENRSVMFDVRKERRESTEGPRARQMAGAYRTPQALRAALNLPLDEIYTKHRNQQDIGFDVSTPGKRVGTALGAMGSDVVQDSSRRWYWLLNAAQATGDMITEETIAQVRPELYQTKEVDSKVPATTKDGNPKFKIVDGKKEPIYKKKIVRKYGPGYVQLLAAPAGVAINTGIGLMTPFGGAEGYKAALPSEDDPTKTSNVIGEVAAKYIMGRTGDLLPWDEFKKVRPDVSRGEYNSYKAFKWDKNTDLNPFDDGVMTAPMGAVKWTNEGIHGPELQFLGKGIPLTTGLIPFASAMGGASLGVSRLGPRRGVMGYDKPIRRGAAGGVTGLIAGEIVGSLLEQERRRRNAAENELNGPQY